MPDFFCRLGLRSCVPLVAERFVTGRLRLGEAANDPATTVDRSGWHVYANMEHLNRYLREKGLPYGKGAYPRIDDILSKAINLSVGVVDAGLGAAFGINIDATDDAIVRAAGRFCEAGAS